MCENDDEKLRFQALLARREELINMKRIIKSSTEDKMNSSGSFIENSDTEDSNRPNVIVNSSIETTESVNIEDDIMRTSTLSLSRSHSFFNKLDENCLDITKDNCEITQTKEVENIQIHSLRVVIEPEIMSNFNTIEMSERPSEVMYSNEEETIHDLTTLNIVKDTDLTNSNILANLNVQHELNQTVEVENVHTLHDLRETSLNLITCEDDIPVNIIVSPQGNESPEICSPSILTDEIERDQQNKVISLEGPSTSRHIPTESNINNIHTKRKRRITSTFVKSCMDFYSNDEENDFSPGSSDLWSEKEDLSSQSSEENDKKKKRKNSKLKNTKKTNNKEIVPMKKRKPENKRKTRKHLKENGLAYETSSGKVKEARKLRENPCKPNKCTKKCFEITEDRRKSIFSYYWSLNDEKKRDWIVQCCRLAEIKRKKTKNTISRRSLSHEYFINEGEGRRKVCQQFILKTLDISQTFLLYTVTHAEEGLSTHDARTRTAPDKYDENTKLKAKKYIESLPALPSHYSRKKSKKLYLPEQFRNLANLYRLYVNHCKELSEISLTEKLFSNIFKEYNIAFHVPKKDKCSTCTKNENNPDTTNNEQLQTHLLEKEATYKRFHVHQNMKPDPTVIVASFDLQKVLGTPYGESMMLYYSRKYAVYNFTVYESNTQNGYSYVWGEADGKRGSCEIATCLYRYLKEVDTRGVAKLILYCDNCTGQNKNRVILSMFKHFLEHSKNLQTIQINYLLSGHTYMPVDSMHAVIEREVKNLIIWAPSQWPTFIESARKRPKSYCVEVLDHADFLNFNILSETIFTPPTLKNKDLRLKQIRVCTFRKTDRTRMHVRYSMLESDTYAIDLCKELLQDTGKGRENRKRTSKGKQKKKVDETCENLEESSSVRQTSNTDIILPSLYTERLPISVAKFNDLKKLCEAGIIPKRFHMEYLNLPNKSKVKDTLNESDDDDSDNGEDDRNDQIVMT